MILVIGRDFPPLGICLYKPLSVSRYSRRYLSKGFKLTSLPMALMGAKNPYLAAIVIQTIYAGMILLSKAVLNAGMNSYVFMFYRQLVGTLFLVPLAVILER